MHDPALQEAVVKRGEALFGAISNEKPALYDQSHWSGKIIEWCLQQEEFRVQLFRFVDVFPTLASHAALLRHLQEYFGDDEQDIPAVLKWGAKHSGLGGALGGAVLAKLIRSNIEHLARQFILGSSPANAAKRFEKLHQQGYAVTIDLLGEATVREEEGEEYQQRCLGLIETLSGFDLPPLNHDLDPAAGWGKAPALNVSIKPSALCAHLRPEDFQGSLDRLEQRTRPILERVAAVGGHLCLDMESIRLKDMTLELYKRLRAAYPEFSQLGIAVQSYLKATDHDLDNLLSWADQERLPISIRLVKGAYWDYETVQACANGWEPPVHTRKSQTDAAFERHARRILQHHEVCYFACASHNIRSIAAVMELAATESVPPERYEFQLLYGMAEPVREAVKQETGRVRLYCPVGEMVPGMAYLVRRLLENTANTSFLRQSFVDRATWQDLLTDPATVQVTEEVGQAGRDHFRNEPAVDFTRKPVREAFPRAIAQIRSELGQDYPLHIAGKSVTTDRWQESTNPANPKETIGRVSQASVAEVTSAITSARRYFPTWADLPSAERCEILRRAASLARGRLVELAAWQVLEIGKQWEQAYADVAEGIDFLEYYAAEAKRLFRGRRLGHAPGEENLLGYRGKGVAAVIAPWNFPFAIACGMVSAALVTGNTVVFKPSGLTPVIGSQLCDLLYEAGIPGEALHFVPGVGGEIGDQLVDDPDISLVAFTGSNEVGRRILQRAAIVHPGQAEVKRVVCEMGGKNAIIVDDDADLDEAIPHVLYSAFGFQGQKCSACSRVIVLEDIYARFIDRLIGSTADLRGGPAEDPAFHYGPVADSAQQQKVFDYIDLARQEGEILYQSTLPEGEGHHVPLTIVGNIRPEHRLAQEEVFGPVLAVMKVKDFRQAIDWANSTPYALTGGVFSRSPAHLEQARRDFRVGNLYFNRNCVGALVGRQPFGGAGMSGVGSKAGGPDYLLQFVNPKVVTENTLRRGFTPIRADDDYI